MSDGRVWELLRGQGERPTRSILALGLAALIFVTGLAVVVAGPADSTPDTAVRLVPDDATGYLHVRLQPSQGRSELAVLPSGVGDDGSLRFVRSLLSASLDRLNLDFRRDVSPWLGSQAAYFAAPGNEAGGHHALLVATTAPSVTRSVVGKAIDDAGVAFEQRSHAGVQYRTNPDVHVAVAVVDGYLIIGGEPALHAVLDARGGNSLADAGAYQRLVDPLAADTIANLYLAEDADPADTRFPGLVDLVTGLVNTPAATAVSLRADELVIEQTSTMASESDEQTPGADNASVSMAGVSALDGYTPTASFGPDVIAGTLDSVTRGDGLLAAAADDLRPWLTSFSRAVVGTKQAGDIRHARMVLDPGES